MSAVAWVVATRSTSPVSGCSSAPVEAGVLEVQHALGAVAALVDASGVGRHTVDPHVLTRPQPFQAVSPATQTGRGKVVDVSIYEGDEDRAGFGPYGPSRAAYRGARGGRACPRALT